MICTNSKYSKAVIIGSFFVILTSQKALILRLLTAIFLFLSFQICGQTTPRIKVAILGTFHFGENNDFFSVKYPGLYTNKKQKELDKLVEKLALFYPNKIFVENTPDFQPFWDKVYAEAKKGSVPANQTVVENEIYQIGIRLARKINDPFGVICVNFQHPEQAGGAFKPKSTFDTLQYYYSAAINNQKPPVELLFENNPPAQNALNTLRRNIAIWQKKDLISFYLNFNQQAQLQSFNYLNNLIYLDQNFNKVGGELSTKEYYRNIKIFQNIISKVNPYDRHLLIIIGAAHVLPLKSIFESHPAFEYVEIEEILKK